MGTHIGFSAALHLHRDKVEEPKVESFIDGQGQRIATIDFGDLTIYGDSNEDLADVLRRLAERVDDAMSAEVAGTMAVAS